MFELKLTREEILAQYEADIEELGKALAGLDESHFNCRRAEGKWSIRQIVHHIVDCEDIFKISIKTALGNSGCTFDFSWYIRDNKCAEPLAYSTRPLKESLDLYRVSRTHLLELMEHLPDGWDRFVLFKIADMPEFKKFTVAGLIGWQIEHLNIHLNQIRETREVHNI